MLGYPWLLLSGKAHRMYVHQAIHAYECIVTIFENEQPISNHYIDYALDQELGIDSKGNLWFGGSSNAFSRKNIADGSFDYFELFQFPLSEFQYGLERKLISGQGEEMFYITHFGKLLHFNGNSWNEIKKNGISLNIKDAAISDSNLLYTISEQDYGKKIDVFNFKTGIWSEIDLSVHGFLRIEAIKKGTNDIIWFSTLQSLGKINQDATVDVFDIPGIYFVEYGSIGFDVSSSGMVQLLGSGNTSSMFVFNPNSEIWSKYDIPDQVLTELDKYESYFKLDHNDNIWIAYTVDQIFGNRTLKVWNFAGGIWNEIVNEQNSNFIYLTGMNELHDGSIVILLQNEIITIGPGGLISGKTLVDKNQNCLYDSVDIGFPELIVSAKNSNGHSNFRYSNKDGHYSIYNTSGKILVNAIPPNPYWISCNPNGVELDLKKDSSVNLDILLDELISCPSIETQISSTSLRQCREATLSINVVNNGTLSADSTFIIVTLPTKLTVLNSSITYDDLGNQRFRFYLGRLNIFESRAFKIKVQVSCDVVLGQSLCIEVSTFPDVLCSVDPLWNGADIRLTATCKNDNASFELYNKGIVATSSPLKYTIFKNDIKLTEANYTLASGEKLNVNIPSDGGTYRLSSNQEKYHPAEKEGLSLAVEGCPELTGPIFTRYVESHRNFLGSPNELIFCFPVTGAYDPNDKIASPVGVGNNTHFIEKDEEIQYTIRFQNTGTDTAFDVKIIDTLNRNLDLSTLKIVQSSHPVSVELNDYVLVLRFSNVYLPDSNIDLTASNGFVKYKITPRANAPLGSFISNKASIYFDFNAAVTTNEVWHIIRPGNDVTSTIDNYKHNDNPAVLVIYPNPTNSGITIDTKAFNDFTLNVYDINGKKSGSRFVSGNFNKIELNLEHYQTGLYFISILNKDGKKYYGKVVKQ
jgi:uncharacterized repeat protein (TIGR01451 family)